MKTLSLITISIILSLTINAGPTSGAKWEDFTQKQVLSKLSKTLDSSTLAVRVKGLVCESCGLGLRKKISKFKAVDTKRFNKGVAMDVHTMVLTVALKEGETLAPQDLKQAISDAGYDAVFYYHMKNGKAVSITL